MNKNPDTHAYPGGTVAEVTSYSGKVHLAFYDAYNRQWVSATSGRLYDGAGVVSIRPLVVVDPAKADELYTAYVNAVSWLAYVPSNRDALVHAIEAMVPTPKPAEPKYLGAVIEDRDGRLHVAIQPGGGGVWRSTRDGLVRGYDEIDVARVVPADEG